MSDFMSLGRRIRHYRMLRGMTQKALGIAAGFPPETADIRIAQYESGARTPKYALLCTLAEALCVPPSVLDIPRIKSREALKKLLLALEDEYGLTVTITEATKGAFAMENEKMIKVVLLEPGKLARAVEIDASLAGMQKVVGGLIEPFYPFEEQVCIVCNVHYCYLLGIFPKNRPQQSRKRLHFLLREDLLKLDAITAETRLIVGHRIDTAEQLFCYRDEVNGKIEVLTADRKQLYKLQRTAAVKSDLEKAAEVKAQIDALSKELAALRKEVVLCNSIAERSGVIQEKIKAVRENEQPERKEKTDHVQFR